MNSAHHTALICDSANDIPISLLEQYNIHFVPVTLVWGAERCRDRVDIQPLDFYTRLASDPVHPYSEPPSVQDFSRVLAWVEKVGAQEAIIITTSGGMSDTILAAREAAELSDMDVYVLDSLSTGMGMGWQVLAAARMRAAGGDTLAMLSAVEAVTETLHYYSYVDTLDYLHRSGRIGGAARLIGGALDFKPVLYLDHNLGTVETAETTRTKQRALPNMLDLFFEQVDTTRPMHIAVVHSGAADDAVVITEQIQRDYKPLELISTIMTPVMGTHVGPGAIGIAGYTE